MNGNRDDFSNLAGEVRAFQQLRYHLAAELEMRVPLDLFVTATAIHVTWGVTAAVLRRLVASGRVRTRQNSRKPTARCKYSLADVLTATIRDGRLASGRIHNKCHDSAPAEYPETPRPDFMAVVDYATTVKRGSPVPNLTCQQTKGVLND